jgi:hypothetical protein
MSRAKRHHHTPQTYLRQFADDDGYLVVYDRILELTRRPNMKDVAVERNLYTIYDANGEPSDMIETQWLAPIEDGFNEIVPKLLSSHPVLTGEERQFVCGFLALQHMRTPHMRDTLANTVDALLRLEVMSRTQGMTPEEADRALDEWNHQASAREKARLRRIAADPSQPVEWDAEPWIKAMIGHLPRLTKGLETREWHLIDAQEGAFLSSDSPIALGGEHPRAIGSAPYLICPLSPKRVLLLGPPGSAPRWRFGRDREHRRGRLVRRRFRRHPVRPEVEHRGFVREVNQLVADVAAREVFWHPDTDPTTDITLPVGTHQATVNGVPLAPGESYFDMIQRDLQRDRGSSVSVPVLELGVRTMRSEALRP